MFLRFLKVHAFFLLCLSSAVHAQTSKIDAASKTGTMRNTQSSLGARVGMVNVNQLDNGLVVYGAFWDQLISNRFTLGASLDYWGMSTGGMSDTRIGIDDVALGGNGKFIFTDVRSDFKPFVTAGLSAHRISVSKAEKAQEGSALARYREKNNDVTTQASIDLGAGAIYTIQPQMDVNGQLLYRRMTNVGVNFNQLALTAGLGYRL